MLTVTKAQSPSHYNVAKHRVYDFVGRENMLQRIDKALITSPGGPGNSQIALENCQKKKSTPYSAIFGKMQARTRLFSEAFKPFRRELKNPGDGLPNIPKQE